MEMMIDVTKDLRTEQGVEEFHYQLRLRQEECLGVKGLSGSGKSCLLKIIAGLTTPETGIIYEGEVPWFHKQKGINVPPQKRNCDYLHQSPVLFPFLSVEKNLLYAAKNHTKAYLQLKILGLERFKQYLPKNLSGGQIKRAALTQLLAFEPPLLLLLEPFVFLDRHWIELISDLLSHYQYEKKRTLVIISHRHELLSSLSDRIIDIVPGGIRSIGFPNHFRCRKEEYPLLYFSRPGESEKCA